LLRRKSKKLTPSAASAIALGKNFNIKFQGV
jgi:hypothetical protein